MKAIWSYWKGENKPFFDFNNELEFIRSLALSLELVKSQFTETELVTTIKGKELIEKYELPFDTIKTDLERFNDVLDSNHWAFVKIYSCAIQRRPFIHIDNDFHLYSTLSENILSSDLFFETLTNKNRYNEMINLFKDFPKVNKEILLQEDFDTTYIFGIIGCNNLSIIEEWCSIVCDFLFNYDNKEHWKKVDDTYKNYSNQLFEQYFLSILAQQKNLVIKILNRQDTYYDHSFAYNKSNPNVIENIKHMLFEKFPQYKNLQ